MSFPVDVYQKLEYIEKAILAVLRNQTVILERLDKLSTQESPQSQEPDQPATEEKPKESVLKKIEHGLEHAGKETEEGLGNAIGEAKFGQ